MFDDKPWFAPKRYGVGAGRPLTWQGCLLITVHILILVALGWWFADRPMMVLATVLPAAFLPLPLYAAKTEGGWHWRWGDEK